MGLFNKHKNQNSEVSQVPPPPPSLGTSSSKTMGNNSGLVAPSPSMTSPKDLSNSPKNSVQPTGDLVKPPVPMGNLSDIRSQVTEPKNSTSESKDLGNKPSEANNSFDFDEEDDSLFDFSNIDLDSENFSDKENKKVESTPNQGNLDQSNPYPQNISNNSNYGQESPNFRNIPSNQSDTNVMSSNDLNFVTNKSVSGGTKANPEVYFVTTSQFKMLLEIVESVKERVKVSSDTHLRLLDIKSEEDIEFENLRKDFQFIEDKLYEVDGIIFDR